MPELTSRELLQPSLLDRLTDDEPHQQVESRDQRVISARKLRELVLRDVAWLLNTDNLDSLGVLEEYPNAAGSVINFGMRDVTGLTTTQLGELELEERVREAIIRFEPRIIPSSVQVRATILPNEADHNALAFEISAELWANPVPESLYIKTKVDLEQGSFELVEQAGGA